MNGDDSYDDDDDYGWMDGDDIYDDDSYDDV